MLFLMFAAQQAFGVRVGQPAAVFCDADGHDLKLLFVDGFDDRCCREQRDFVLATASAEYDSDPHFCHGKRIAASSRTGAAVVCSTVAPAGALRRVVVAFRRPLGIATMLRG